MERGQGETQGADRGPGGLLRAAVMSTQQEEMAPLGVFLRAGPRGLGEAVSGWHRHCLTA